MSVTGRSAVLRGEVDLGSTEENGVRAVVFDLAAADSDKGVTKLGRDLAGSEIHSYSSVGVFTWKSESSGTSAEGWKNVAMCEPSEPSTYPFKPPVRT